MYAIFRLIALIIMMLMIQTVTAAEAVIDAEVVDAESTKPAALPPAYPEWPQQTAHVSAVPAPPLGPYMSTGLQGATRGFACCEQRDAGSEDSLSLENAPWPKRRLPPRQWQPENGEYSYAPGDAAEVTGTGQQGKYGRPDSSWPQQMRPAMYQRPNQGGFR